MQKITPFLWFDGQAEDAAKLYVSIFEGSKILSTTPGPGGTVMSVNFLLDGREYMALNGGPTYKLTEAFSFFVSCKTQGEVDELWDRLLAGGGSPNRCGWLKDKFGVSWQIIPTRLPELLGDPDPGRRQRALTAMLGMNKIDVQALEDAVSRH